MAEAPRSEESLFHTVDDFPFHIYAEFKQGLDALLASSQDADLDATTDRAKAFFYNRTTDSSVDVAAYVEWARQRRAAEKAQATASLSAATELPNPNTHSPSEVLSDPSAPPVPLSYQQIVDLIVAGEPVPGVRQIPDTVLGLDASSKPSMEPRRKPWETGPSS